MSKFKNIQVGDKVTRMLAGTVPVELTVTAVDDLIHCGPWMFSRNNGAEIDPELGWDETRTGSYLVSPEADAVASKLLGTDGNATEPTSR